MIFPRHSKKSQSLSGRGKSTSRLIQLPGRAQNPTRVQWPKDYAMWRFLYHPTSSYIWYKISYNSMVSALLPRAKQAGANQHPKSHRNYPVWPLPQQTMPCFILCEKPSSGLSLLSPYPRETLSVMYSAGNAFRFLNVPSILIPLSNQRRHKVKNYV